MATLKRKALFLAVDAGCTGAQQAALCGLARDYAAMGYVVVPVLAQRSVSLDEVLETLGAACVEVVESLVVGADGDPASVWEAARRFDLDLARSVALTTALDAACGALISAGVRRERTRLAA